MAPAKTASCSQFPASSQSLLLSLDRLALSVSRRMPGIVARTMLAGPHSNAPHHNPAGANGASSRAKDDGKSFEGKDLRALVIERSAGGSGPDLLVLAGMHAREWNTMAAVMCLLASRMPRLVDLFVRNGARLVVIPLVNPDGFDFSKGFKRHWRKTRSKVDGVDGVAAVGVDLNRNFAVNEKWNETMEMPQPKSEVYAGPWPFSEREARAVKYVVQKWLRPNSMVIDVHCCAKAVLPPLGGSVEQEFQAEILANASAIITKRERTPPKDEPANTGIAIDWMQNQTNIRSAFIFEVPGRPNHQSFKELFRALPNSIQPTALLLEQVLEKLATFFFTTPEEWKAIEYVLAKERKAREEAIARNETVSSVTDDTSLLTDEDSLHVLESLSEEEPKENKYPEAEITDWSTNSFHLENTTTILRNAWNSHDGDDMGSLSFKKAAAAAVQPVARYGADISMEIMVTAISLLVVLFLLCVRSRKPLRRSTNNVGN